MSVNLPEHDHCRYCGDPVPFEQAYCSEECYYSDQEKIGKEKRTSTLIGALAVGGSILILVLGYLYRGDEWGRPVRTIRSINSLI